VQPEANSKSSLKVLGWGPGANCLELNANNQTSLGAPVAPSQFLTDDRAGDSTITNTTNSTVYPNATLRFGFSDAGSLLALTRSLFTSNVPLGTTVIYGQPWIIGGTQGVLTLGSMNIDVQKKINDLIADNWLLTITPLPSVLS
jgi:hypothetical protein